MLLVKNHKALFNNELIEKYTAGIILTGYEVKAIREKNVNFEGSYVGFDDGSLYLINCNVGRYSKQSQSFVDHQTNHPKKLLLNKIELKKLKSALTQKGKTAVPLAFILSNNLIKLEFALVKGMKKYEQKQLLKKRQVEMDLQKMSKNAGFDLR